MSHMHTAARGSRWWRVLGTRRYVRVTRLIELVAAAAAAAVLAVLFIPADPPAVSLTPVEQPDLNVAVVPALDSAGFFIALYQGLFNAQGLDVHFVPAISSETVIDDQVLSLPMKAPIGISCGNYVSYIQAQHAWDSGERPSPAQPSVVAADLDIFAEGSVMQPAAQGLYVLPGGKIRTLADLEGRTVGVNAPGNILYLLAASALASDRVAGVGFAYYPLPEMAHMLKVGKISAAVLPEPFASQAEMSLGVVPLADLDQGSTQGFPVQGCAVTKAFARAYPRTLAAFRKAFEQGQQIADTSRPAVEKAMESLPAPLAVSKVTAAVMALDLYPVGPVDAVRIQRVADVMSEFLSFPRFSIGSMLNDGS